MFRTSPFLRLEKLRCTQQAKAHRTKRCAAWRTTKKVPGTSDSGDFFDAYGLLRAMHSRFYAPLRSVLNMCHWHIAPYPLFAYRGIIIPLLCSYRGGSKSLSPTYEQAHVGLDLLTLASYTIQYPERSLHLQPSGSLRCSHLLRSCLPYRTFWLHHPGCGRCSP